MASVKVTALDVARLAGVSQSAVSRVFTPGASASKSTADKVKAAAAELGYRPNATARSLITGRSRVIALVVAYLENHFYPDALERLSRELQQRGYHIMIFLAGNAQERVDPVLEELLDHQVDGVIAASVSMSNALAERCQDAGIPIVMFNRGQDDDRLSEVTSDNRAGGFKAARLLTALGCERLAHTSGWSGSSTGRDRANGFLSGLQEAGRAAIDIIDGMYQREAAAAAARDLFAREERPDGIFVGNDHMAFAVMDVLRFELGLRIPEDVAVVGYDDVPMSSWPAYNLTTIRQPVNRMVAATVDALLDRIDDAEAKPRKIRIEGPLMMRGSAPRPEGWK